MSDVKRACAMLEELRCLGVMLQIDDFGTGYSSLEALYDFPLDALKLDRSFVARLDDPRSAGLVQAMVAMGRNLGLAVGAVGVETAGQRAQLRRMGCSYAQGYFFSRPVPAAAVTRRSLTCARTPDKRPLGGQSPPMHPLPTGC
jgi:EAL domain-containing protein (putative c-di-GMP-specific phosphodiesterase class I)